MLTSHYDHVATRGLSSQRSGAAGLFPNTQTNPALTFKGAINTAEQVGQPIKYLKIADRIAAFFNKPLIKNSITGEVNLWNLSLYDWMTRMMLVFCLYIPQAFTSIRNDQHKYETSGRNMLTWTMALGTGILMKHDRFSFNTLFDRLMMPQGTPYEILTNKLNRAKSHLETLEKSIKAHKPKQGTDWSAIQRLQNRLNLMPNTPKLSKDERQAVKAYLKNKNLAHRLEQKIIPSLTQKQSQLIKTHGDIEHAKVAKGNWFDQTLNRFRLPMDYYELLGNPKVGVKITPHDRYRAFWASMNALDFDLVIKRLDELKQLQRLDKLTQQEKVEFKTLKQFLSRVSHFKFIAFGLDLTLSIMLTGFLLMYMVFNFVAPLDHDFDPDQMPGQLKKKIREGHGLPKNKPSEPGGVLA